MSHPLHKEVCAPKIEAILLCALRLRNQQRHTSPEQPASIGMMPPELLVQVLRTAAPTLPQMYSSSNRYSEPDSTLTWLTNTVHDANVILNISEVQLKQAQTYFNRAAQLSFKARGRSKLTVKRASTTLVACQRQLVYKRSELVRSKDNVKFVNNALNEHIRKRDYERTKYER